MSMDSINGISYYLNTCRRYQTHQRSQERQRIGVLCIQHSPTAVALSTKTAFEWKMWFSCFPVLPGSTEAQVIWGGILKHLLTAYFTGNISAKKYQNLLICVKVIASHKWDVFETRRRSRKYFHLTVVQNNWHQSNSFTSPSFNFNDLSCLQILTSKLSNIQTWVIWHP